MKGVGIVYRSDGSFNLGVYPENEGKQYEFIKSNTGNGTISRVVCSLDGVLTDMWVNEDFISLELPLNEVATICHAQTVGWDDAYICGDVVFTGPTNRDDGSNRGLTTDEAAILLSYLVRTEELTMLAKSAVHNGKRT